ncbi:MAG: thermonuclease family protein, partial [Spirochaetales bacterium]|nr:thermonuclease family protein [Spirochaetales bacterium]
LVTLLVLFSSTLAYAEQCHVNKVSDGDTIKVTCNGRKVKIRLYGVDTPESKQRYGMEATQYTEQAVLNKIVDIRIIDTDRYGRSVAVVKQGGFNLNEMLVRKGHAWVYDKYCKESFCADFNQYEKQARQQRIGLWEDNTPKAPWDYRKALRGGSSASNNKSQVTHSGNYHGNLKSHVFHGSSCQHYNCKNCRKSFSSKSQAVGTGYKPHNQCVN